MATAEQVGQIKEDVAALQMAGAAAADQLQALTSQVLALQAGTITDEQVQNLHDALQGVTSQLVASTTASQEATGTGSAGSSEAPPAFREPFDQENPEHN